MLPRKVKHLLFRRGHMPDGDFRDLFDRLRGRFGEITDPAAKKHLTGRAATILGAGLNSDGAGPSLDEQYAAFRKETGQRFIEVFQQEAEAQWDRIVDRRVSAWFYSVIIAAIIGYVLGRLS